MIEPSSTSRDDRRRVGSFVLIAWIGLSLATATSYAESYAPVAEANADSTAEATAPTYAELARQALENDYAGQHGVAAEIVRLMRERDPANPVGALREVENQYWYFMYDTPGVRDDEALERSIDASVSLAKRSLAGRPDDYAARSLYGQALMDDARRLAMTGHYYGAGSTSEKARKILEDVVEERPDDMSARYQLGNYYYWSSVMPSMLRAFDWLWFIPKGNRALGLAYLQAVAASDSIHADGARMVLGVVEMYHEPIDLESAYDRIAALHARYPRNVLIHYEFLEVLYLLERYDMLLESAARLEARVDEPQPVRAHALMASTWKGRVAMRRGDPVEPALELFDALAQNPVDLPHWGPAWIDLMQGQALDVLGMRTEALAAYDRVLAYDDELETRRAARQAERLKLAPFDPDTFRPEPMVKSAD